MDSQNKDTSLQNDDLDDVEATSIAMEEVEMASEETQKRKNGHNEGEDKGAQALRAQGERIKASYPS